MVGKISRRAGRLFAEDLALTSPYRPMDITAVRFRVEAVSYSVLSLKVGGDQVT